MRLAAPLLTAAPALLLSTALLLPFHDKAFTIDDTVFLREAEHVLVDPLHPTAFDYPWFAVPERLSTIVPTGPLGAWALVPTVSGVPSETAGHLTTLAFLWLAIIATVSLALRLGLTPTAAASAGLLLAASPAVLAMAGTVMPDVLAMALGAAGLERLLAWKQGRRLRDGLAAALLLGMAPQARTHLLLLLPIGATLLQDRPFAGATWRHLEARRLLPIGGALLVTLVLVVLTRDPAAPAGSIQGALAGLTSVKRLSPNTVSFLVDWMATTTMGLAWAALRWRALLARWWLALVGAVGATILLRLFHGEWVHLPVAAVAGVGLLVLLDVALDAMERRDHLQGVLWLCLLLPMAAGIYIHFAAKYLLVAAPAAAILVARRLPVSTVRTWAVTGGVAALGCLLGVAILRADAAFAELGRRAGATLIAPRVASGERVWFVGHWGFQWYAEQAGARFFSGEPPYPRPGDVVVASRASDPHFDVEEIPNVIEPLERLEEPRTGGRLMDRRLGAGFYSNSWGYWPWAWGEGPLDTFLVGRVRASR